MAGSFDEWETTPWRSTSQVREYRATLGRLLIATIAFSCLAGGLMVLATFLATIGVPLLLVAPVGALAATFLILIVARARSVTIIDVDHITVRVFRTRRSAWRDILAIEGEINLVRAVDETQPVQCVAIYDCAGGRLALPHLDVRLGPGAPRGAGPARDVGATAWRGLDASAGGRPGHEVEGEVEGSGAGENPGGDR